MLIIIVVIIIGGAVFLFTNKAEAPKDQNTSQQEQGGVTSQVPAPGNEGVEEMIVILDDDDTSSDKDKVIDSKVTVVTYTNDGFSPQEVVIKQGQVVRFVNESSSSMWVASAIHPTHSLYPAKSGGDCLGSSFDQCTITGAGGVWEFTFTETGTHGYHNHVRASKRGKIIVE